MLQNTDHQSLKQLLTSGPAIKGLMIGIVLGIIDNVFFWALGVKMELAGWDARLMIGVFFTLSFGGFTWIIGALIENRRQLKKLQRRLVETETLATVGRLAAGVAHEVRNPLAVIRSSANLVLKDLDETTDSFRACQFVSEEVDRLNSYVSRLLNFSKPLSPHFRVGNPWGSIQEAVKLTEHPPSILIDLIPPPHDIIIDMDQDLLTPVIVSLITNSVQALGEEGTITIGLYQEGHQAYIKIADNGPGLNKEIRARAFEPFVTTKANGTGLGLSMAQKVITALNGEIRFVEKNGPGEQAGASILMTFPLKREPEPKGA